MVLRYSNYFGFGSKLNFGNDFIEITKKNFPFFSSTWGKSSKINPRLNCEILMVSYPQTVDI